MQKATDFFLIFIFFKFIRFLRAKKTKLEWAYWYLSIWKTPIAIWWGTAGRILRWLQDICLLVDIFYIKLSTFQQKVTPGGPYLGESFRRWWRTKRHSSCWPWRQCHGVLLVAVESLGCVQLSRDPGYCSPPCPLAARKWSQPTTMWALRGTLVHSQDSSPSGHPDCCLVRPWAGDPR